MLETRPATASATSTSKSNKRPQVKEVSPKKMSSKPELKEMTFSPSKLKKETVPKVDEMQYSMKDKMFIPSTYSIRDEQTSVERNVQSRDDQGPVRTFRNKLIIDILV